MNYVWGPVHLLPHPWHSLIPSHPHFLPSVSVELNNISDARLKFILTFKNLNKYTDVSVIILYREFNYIEAFFGRFTSLFTIPSVVHQWIPVQCVDTKIIFLKIIARNPALSRSSYLFLGPVSTSQSTSTSFVRRFYYFRAPTIFRKIF